MLTSFRFVFVILSWTLEKPLKIADYMFWPLKKK
jgi:hypothetical protein